MQCTGRLSVMLQIVRITAFVREFVRFNAGSYVDGELSVVLKHLQRAQVCSFKVPTTLTETVSGGVLYHCTIIFCSTVKGSEHLEK